MARTQSSSFFRPFLVSSGIIFYAAITSILKGETPTPETEGAHLTSKIQLTHFYFKDMKKSPQCDKDGLLLPPQESSLLWFPEQTNLFLAAGKDVLPWLHLQVICHYLLLLFFCFLFCFLLFWLEAKLRNSLVSWNFIYCLEELSIWFSCSSFHNDPVPSPDSCLLLTDPETWSGQQQQQRDFLGTMPRKGLEALNWNEGAAGKEEELNSVSWLCRTGKPRLSSWLSKQKP